MLPILFIFSFLIGSISAAIIICRVFNLPDSRLHGSKNPGATNVLRIVGKKVAFIVLVSDGLKGAIPVLIANYLGFSLFNTTLIIMAVFLGHVYPIFFGFKGGKGVATFLGALLALNYFIGLIFATIWLLIANISKISSLAALVATFFTPTYFYIITQNLNATYVIVVICLWIFFTHRDNVQRMLYAAKGKFNFKL